jgi:hypothetical protein
MVAVKFTTANSGSQVPLSLHQNFPTLSLRKTSGVPQPVAKKNFPPHGRPKTEKPSTKDLVFSAFIQAERSETIYGMINILW